MHGRKYRNAARTCDVIFANSAFTADDAAETLGFPRERDRRRPPGDRRRVHRRRGALPTGAAVPAHRGDARAAQEPRHARRRLRAARRHRPRARRRGRSRAGASSRSSTGRASSGSAASPTRSSRASTAAPRRSSTRRASRASGCRSPRRWPRARRSSPRRTRRSTRPAGDAAVRADPESAEAIAEAIRAALERRDELRAKGLAHAAGFSWRRTGEIFLEGYRRFS